MMKENRVVLHVKSIGENVALVRMVASGFLIPYDLTMEELDEIKIALFGGDGDVTDEMWEEVKRFVEFVKSKKDR